MLTLDESITCRVALDDYIEYCREQRKLCIELGLLNSSAHWYERIQHAKSADAALIEMGWRS